MTAVGPEDGVVVEGPLPREATGRLLVPFRPGDVVRVSTPFVETTVTGVTGAEVRLRWPWLRNDPRSDYDWSRAEFTFPVDEQARFLYRTEPSMGQLTLGQRCRVGIPPTIAQVLDVILLHAPEDTGMLPRPSGWLLVLPAGMSFDPADPVGMRLELIAAREPDGPTPGVEMAEPTRIELLFRPYAFLADGDVVTDVRGNRWRFQAPFWWRSLDDRARPAAAPAWPLRLAPDDGKADARRGAEVAAATAAGSHADEVGRWSKLVGAKPVPTRFATSARRRGADRAPGPPA